MPELRITIPEALDAKIEAAMPEYLDRKGFLCLLIDQALDEPLPTRMIVGKGGRGVGASEPQASNSQQPEAFNSSLGREELKPSKNKGTKFVFSVPPSLDAVRQELTSFWKEYKAGRKSRAAAALLITGCQDILDKYGEKVLREQIELACANNWQSITLKGYEQFGLPRRPGNAPAQPEHKHPAGRVFQNGRFVDEEPPVTNPATKGLF